MEVSREEFLQWTESPVTREIFSLMEARINDAKDILAVTAGDDSRADGILVGMIKAYNELLGITYED